MAFSSYFDKVKTEVASTKQQKSKKGPEAPPTTEPVDSSTAELKKNKKNKKKKTSNNDGTKTNPARQNQENGQKGQEDAKPERGAEQKTTRKRHRKNDYPNSSRAKAPRRSRPSPEALELSKRLMELSKQKKLEQALLLYEDKSNDRIRDAHHACIVVDCCARCGDVSKAEGVVQGIWVHDRTIELQTALIKGYAHAGDLHNAMRVFRSLFSPNNRHPPNVRTLNTLLRGCLWTAAMPQSDDGQNVAGGVVSSEEAWSLYKKRCQEDSPPDSSSYEATVSILCQALRMEAAKARIESFQQQFNIRIKGKASIKAEAPDQSILEVLGSIYLSLARASAMLGAWEDVWRSCQRSMNSIQASRSLLLDAEQDLIANSDTKKKSISASGGKRGWKRGAEDELEKRRSASNTTYRQHRLNEMEMEVKTLLKVRVATLENSKSEKKDSMKQLKDRIANGIFYFGGGGSTELSRTKAGEVEKTKGESSTSSVLPNWLSFGLCEASGGDEKSNGIKDQMDPPENVKNSYNSCFDSKGRLRVDSLFNAEDDNPKPLDLELGAGFGDWIVSQAEHCRERNFIAVELRSDRSYQIFTKAALSSPTPLTNLCVVGADAGFLLRHKIAKRSLSNLFVNHPEPPTQTFGEDRVDLKSVESGKAEPAHMLCHDTLKAAFDCLRTGGKIIIVTDNHWYARLLCTTLVRLSRQEKSMCPIDSSQLTQRGFRSVEKFGNGIQFYEGQPNEAIGHVVIKQGNSYFDRLWRTGTSNYAQKSSRFVVAVQRK